MKEKSQMHKNHRERMKSVFLEHGFSAFSEVQKLEFILFFAIPQKDVNPIAHYLLNEYGSLNKVFAADYNDLLKIDGIGKHAATLLKTCRSICLEQNQSGNSTSLKSTDIAKEYCYKLLKDSLIEEFYVVCMNDSNKILKTKKINSGSANKVHVEISDITRLAFTHNATKIIIAHNHPSGSLSFSMDDIHLTHSIICSCLLNGIRVVDHVLTTHENAISLAESNYMVALENVALNSLNIKRKAIIPDPACPYEDYVVINQTEEIPDASKFNLKKPTNV